MAAAAVTAPRQAASTASSPRASPAANPPQKLSPAPVGSTTSAGAAGTQAGGNPGRTTSAPSPPSLTTTHVTPAASRPSVRLTIACLIRSVSTGMPGTP